MPDIEYKDNHHSHVFCCLTKGCGGVVHHFMDNDASTSNLIKHAWKCFGENTIKFARSAKNAQEVHDKIIGSIPRDESITAMYEWKDCEKVTCSHCQHMKMVTRYVVLHTYRPPVETLDRTELVHWVSESNWPFNIVEDCS